MQINSLISSDNIKNRIRELASEIKKEFPQEVHCIIILEGAVYFFNSLKEELEKLGIKVKSSKVKLSSYKGKESTGKIVMASGMKININEKNMLIVEDIIDSGLTLDFLKNHLKENGAEKVKIAVLLDKKEKRRVPVKADYIGFEIPDKFVIGYGLDYNGKYRELDYIGYIE